jgi:hypothetical protein
MESSGWSLETLEENVVWRGEKDKFPTSKALQDIVSQNLSPEQLVDFTIQAVRYCPSKALPNLLSYFSCSCWAVDGPLDIKRLFSLPNANKRSMCGKPVKKGDIMWLCRQCGKDPTCVQCDDCFQSSNHEGHEVYFYRSSASGGGGCCDCGDPEAWHEDGNCCNHGTDRSSKSVDPASVIPKELLVTLDAVISGIFLVLLNVITTELSGFDAPSKHTPTILPEELVIRLHNDDLHTFEDVTSALISTGLTQRTAAALTMRVDQDGCASVLTTGNKSEVQRLWDILGKGASLLVSAVPASAVAIEENLTVAWAWLMQLASSNDGLMRLLTQRFLESTDALCAIVKGPGAEIMQRHLPGPLISYPSHLPLRPGGTFPNPPPAPGARDGHRGVVIVPPGSDGARTDDITQVTRLTPFAPLNDSESAVETSSQMHYTPHVMMAVLLVGSPYLSKTIQKGLHDAVILLQQDVLFKTGFSQLLVHTYPTLAVLFFHGIGTHNDTIFTSSVQVFTSDSVVRMMSSEGVDTRPLPVPYNSDDRTNRHIITVTSTITSCILAAFRNLDCDYNRDNDDFMQDFIMKNRRIVHMCRDLEYVAGCADQAKDFFFYKDVTGRRPVCMCAT